MLQIRLLGQFDVRLDGKRVLISSRAGQSLLAYLALSSGTLHRREKRAGIFWPEVTEEKARTYLRHELWRIRKAIPTQGLAAADEYLLADEFTLAFNPHSDYWLDVAILERQAQDADSLASSLSLYQGELLGQLRLLARRSGEDWGELAAAIDLAAWLSPPLGNTLHDEPLVRRFSGFLDTALCEWLIDQARARLRPAMIYSGESTHDTRDEMRTNSVAVWNLGCMDFVNVVLQYRIAAACAMPLDNLEAPTALRYRVGEQITNHYDYLNPRSPIYVTEIATRGERVIHISTQETVEHLRAYYDQLLAAMIEMLQLDHRLERQLVSPAACP